MTIVFLDYKVNYASFKLNPEIAPNRNYKMMPKIGCSIKRVENKLLVAFTVEVVKGEDPLPFDFKLMADGIFSFGEGDDPAAAQTAAAEMLFPYVRASVASLTQLANVPPYNLPFVNIAQLIGKAAASVKPSPLN